MIVGTAGHIDHGKTTLTRALTGVDTDRLKEEKARGISIELGYAYVAVAPDRSTVQRGASGNADGDASEVAVDEILGIIDVPGHERLVHTMASGSTGIDYALLVIAADDGVMPQTREHLAILLLLGVSAGAVAITKTDRVDAGRLMAVRSEIDDLLAGTLLAGAPFFETNATQADDPGTQALLAHLKAVAAGWRLRHNDGLFRLAVDRVFTLTGQGTVVTGTVFAGRVRVGDTFFRVPEASNALPVKIRGIHAQNRTASEGLAGQRCALNLAGIEKEAVQRGDWIVDPLLRAASPRLDCTLSLLPDAGLTLTHWTPLHVHLGSGHQVAHAVLLDGETMASGQTARVQLVFDGPISAVPGDRFIVRNAQASRTVGGGRVLDPFAPARHRRSPTRRIWLDALSAMIDGGGGNALLAASADGIAVATLIHLTGRPFSAITLPEGVVQLAVRPEAAAGWLFDRICWLAWGERAEAALRLYHQRHADEQGVEMSRLRRMVMPQADESLWRAAVQRWVADGRLMLSGPWLHLAEHAVRLEPADELLALRLVPRLVAGEFDPPWVRDLANMESVEEEAIRTVLRKLARQGKIFQPVRDLFYDKSRIAEMAALAERIAAQSVNGEVSAAAFRDATGLGRKRAIQVLEFFDRVGYTRRQRDTHLLRSDSRWRELLMSA